jgi:hypothetical protein
VRTGQYHLGIAGSISVLAVLTLAPLAHAQIAVRNQGYIPFSDPPISYRSTEPKDPVAQLQKRMEEGKVNLEFDAEHGYLTSVLKLLNVPVDSQMLVFSKTSFQYPKISPEHPRALYFNDDVYVGSVHDGKAVEIVSFDPVQGAIFYLLDERKSEHPAFQRAELDCTQCHIAAATRGVPGVLLRSVYPTASGTLVAGTKQFVTDQDSPLSERWGGWYVSNVAAGRTGMANTAALSPDGQTAPDAELGAANLSPLAPQFEAANYLTPSSDLVAQLVMAHQTQMHNLITLTNYKTRLALYGQGQQPSSTADAGAASLSESARPQMERPAEQLLRYLLFANEASLSGFDAQKVVAESAFARSFSKRGARDAKGRSLRDFDLNSRLFRYPCSYLIYSDAFDDLPTPAKTYVYHRLLEVLSGHEQGADFARLSAASRREILEILLDTKAGLPQEWHDYAKANHLRVLKAVVTEQSLSTGQPLGEKPLAKNTDQSLADFARDLQAAARIND